MKMVVRVFLSALIVLAVSVFAEGKLPSEFKNLDWQTGDVIGISELQTDDSTLFFEAATGSRFGHVGLVAVEKGKVYVYEENPPHAARVRLENFLGRAGKSANGKKLLAAVLRIEPSLNSLELNAILSAAKDAVARKIPYNHQQTMNESSMNCSEFVHYLFKKANRSVGLVERVRDQNIHAFNGILLKAWQSRAGELNLDSQVVTPMSVILSDSLVPILANVPTEKYLSDHELFKQWDSEGVIDKIVESWGVPSAFLRMAGASASPVPWRDLKPRGQRGYPQ